MRKAGLLIAAAAALPGLLVGAALTSATAHAATGTTTATTHLTNRLDSGFGGNNWASDTIDRTVTITLTGPDATVTGMYDYTDTITDTGTAHALTGVTSPGAQGIPIVGTPKAAIAGQVTGTFTASSNAPVAALMPAAESGNGESTSSWVEQLFPSGTTFDVTHEEDVWSWTYKDAADCQQWVDAYNVAKADSGDITGVSTCPPAPPAPVIPVLSHGHAVSVSPHRENVFFDQSVGSVDKFMIVGPGAINGHVGWVNAHAGTNAAVYTGLLADHGYTVYYQPYTAKNGSPIAGSHQGYVYFRTAPDSIAGEFCSHHGATETVDGVHYQCRNVNGWRWETV